jgi:hypothetical protein
MAITSQAQETYLDYTVASCHKDGMLIGRQGGDSLVDLFDSMHREMRRAAELSIVE